MIKKLLVLTIILFCLTNAAAVYSTTAVELENYALPTFKYITSLNLNALNSPGIISRISPGQIWNIHFFINNLIQQNLMIDPAILGSRINLGMITDSDFVLFIKIEPEKLFEAIYQSILKQDMECKILTRSGSLVSVELENGITLLVMIESKLLLAGPRELMTEDAAALFEEYLSDFLRGVSLTSDFIFYRQESEPLLSFLTAVAKNSSHNFLAQNILKTDILPLMDLVDSVFLEIVSFGIVLKLRPLPPTDPAELETRLKSAREKIINQVINDLKFGQQQASSSKVSELFNLKVYQKLFQHNTLLEILHKITLSSSSRETIIRINIDFTEPLITWNFISAMLLELCR